MQVLFASVEVAPFAWTGGLGDVAGSLPKALSEMGVDMRVIMPAHRGARDQAEQVHRIVDSCPVHMPWWVTGCAIDQTNLPGSEVPLYLVEHSQYFNRSGIFGPAGGSYPDNLERFVFFCRAVIESLAGLQWQPDIIHLNDWHTALLALYQKSWGHGFRTLYTAHQLAPAFHGLFPAEHQWVAGIDWGRPETRRFVANGQIDLARAGLALADASNTVSERYAWEVSQPGSEEGVADLVSDLGDRFRGILNGVDYERWDPASDQVIAAPYSTRDLLGKAVCKQNLQRMASLAEDPDMPLIAMVSRLDALKGFDLVLSALPRIAGAQMVFLGAGEDRYARALGSTAMSRDDVTAFIEFDEGMARHLYAGADMLLMPSRREPSGLAQMVAAKYGAIPIVHKTGGLADTITESPDSQNGFVFETYSV